MSSNTIIPAKSKTRKLKATWTVGAHNDLVGGPRRNPAWLWVHIDEIRDRLYYLVSGKYPSRWIEREVTESMSKSITEEIDKEILENLLKIYPGKNNP